MRKLLVASQKGGVGKTTTSINLAASAALAGTRVLLLDADPLSNISASLNLSAHAQRQRLRDAGVDLPGVLTTDVLPGLDVLSPYDDGGCSDEDLDGLLALLATPSFQESYGALVVDTPPFMGANPSQLLASSDEFIIVMRAEPMAYRTLPAFLELVQRAKNGREIKLRGILLTLPSGENPGGRWERELRGRLGTRILPLVLPHDEAAEQASSFGQIVSQATPDAPVSRTYVSLVEHLNLSADARETKGRAAGAAALLLASASVKNSAARRPASRSTPAVKVAEPRREPTPEPAADVYAPTKRRRTPVKPVPVVASRPRTPPVQALDPVTETPAPAPKPAPAPATAAAPPEDVEKQFPLGVGFVWVGVAVAVGISLRFLKLPDFVVPVLIGVGVGAAVVVAARYLMLQDEKKSDKPDAAKKPSKPTTPASRLAELKRRTKQPARDLSEN